MAASRIDIFQILITVSRKLAQNAVYILVSQLSLVVLGVAAAALIYGRLGADVLGLIYFVSTVAAVLGSIAQLGIGATTTREVAVAGEDAQSGIAFLQVSGFIAWSTYGGLSLILWIIAPYITEHWIQLATLAPGDATWGIRILGVTALLCVPRALYVGILQGQQRIGLSSALDIGLSVLQQGALLATVMRGASTRQVLLVLAVTNVVIIVTHVVACAAITSFRALCPNWNAEFKGHTRTFLQTMTGISILGLLHGYLPRVAVSGFLPLGAMGHFGVVTTMTSRVGVAADAIAQAAFPALSASKGRLCEGATPVSLGHFAQICTLPVAAGFALGAHPVFAVAFGPDIGRALVLPTVLLCLGAYARAIFLVPYYASLAAAAPRPAFLANLELLPVMAPLTVALVYRWQLVGASLAVLVYQLLVVIRFLPRVMHVIGSTTTIVLQNAAALLALTLMAYSGPAIVMFFFPSWTTAVLGFMVGTSVLVASMYREGHLDTVGLILGYENPVRIIATPTE